MGYNPQGIMNIYEIIRRWHTSQTISDNPKAIRTPISQRLRKR